MRVYRIENRTTAFGPYWAPSDPDLISKIHNRSPNHPGWDKSGFIQFYYNSECARAGFSSKKQMKTWFKGLFTFLMGRGHQVSCYLISKEHTQQTEKELIFDLHHATKLWTKPIWEVLA